MSDYTYCSQTTVTMETQDDSIEDVYLGETIHRFGFSNTIDNVSDSEYYTKKVSKQLTILNRLTPIALPDNNYTDFMQYVITTFYGAEGDFTMYELRGYLLSKVIQTSKLQAKNVPFNPVEYLDIDTELTDTLQQNNIHIEFYYNLLLVAVQLFCKKHEKYIESRELNIMTDTQKPEITDDVYIYPTGFVPPLGKLFDINPEQYELQQQSSDSIQINTSNFDKIFNKTSNNTLQQLYHPDYINFMDDVFNPIVVSGKYSFKDMLYCLLNTMMAGDDPIIPELQTVINTDSKEHQIYLKVFYPVLFNVYRDMSELDDLTLQTKMSDETSNLPVTMESDKQ